jgi:3-phosphoglycerate kinase
MKTLKDIEHLEGVKVLVRADFNVPVINGAVADVFRIKSTLPTIDFLRQKDAKVILISHLEDANGGNGTLEPIAKSLQKMGEPVEFVKDWKNAHEKIEHMDNGKCILLENLRFFEGEKKNDQKFSQELASLADIYVNDAFSVSHRKHASVVGVPAFIPGYAGLQLEKEIGSLSKAFNPPRPFLFILGGAKFETKLPLLERLIDIADKVFVGGALSNDLFKEKGYEMGKSLVSKSDSEQKLDFSKYINNPKLSLPIDILTHNREVKLAAGLSPDDQVMDAGPKTVEFLKSLIIGTKFILWNGPLGSYENGYQGATLDLAKMLAEATQNGVETMIGGGDTLAAVGTLGLQDKFSFISTGGGAMLDYLAKGTLPGIGALK